MKKYYQLIPEKVAEILPTLEALVSPEIPGYNTDYLLEVVSMVCCHVRRDEATTPLVMKFIKKLVPQGDKYLAALIGAGIVQRSGYYSPGGGAYQYNFAPEYVSKFTTRGLTNARLIYRIEQVHEKLRRDAAKSIRGHNEQVKYLKMLTIDQGFMNFINDKYTADTDAYNRVMSSAVRIMNGDITFSIDTTSGRFHSNVTNCPAGFRPHLRIKNKPLTNIDVKNCQPYLSTLILTNPGKVSAFTENAAFAMVLQSLKVSHNEDVKNYIKLVINGQLYEYLMQEFARDGLHLDRQATKRQVLRILFARNRTPKDATNKQAREIFKSRFPTVHKIFTKVRGHERGDRFTSFKRFAILLQRMESYLMLDVILKRIYRELPGVIAITIHDSIMTGVLTDNVEAVKNILIEELTNFVGFRPNVSLEMNKEILEEEERGRVLYRQYGATTFVSTN